MTFVDGMGNTRDTATAPIGYLMYLAKRFTRRNDVAWAFEKGNGEESIVRFVRAIRARMFRERLPIRPRCRHMLNTLDAPRCRCGKPGTRIQSGATFCTACGPTAAVRARKAYIVHTWEAGAKVLERDHVEFDRQQLGLKHLRANRLGHHGSKR